PVDGLSFANFTKNLCGMLAEPRGGPRCGHRLAADHDRRAHAGDYSALGRGTWKLEAHATVHYLRIGKDLVEVIDRPGRYADRLEFRQQSGTLHPLREVAQARNQGLRMRQTAGVVALFALFGQPPP